jgi:SHO1 osmosensor
MIAFVSSIIADIQGDYPNYSWWSLAFMLMCIIAVFVTVATDSVHTYHVALVGLLSAGLVFTTSSVNSLIYYSDAAKEAAAAGFILLSMVSVRWDRFYRFRSPSANKTIRSSGSFTTARNRQHLTAALSTPLHCTKRAHPLAAADTCRKTPTDQTPSAPAATNHKCTMPTSSLALKHHHP